MFKLEIPIRYLIYYQMKASWSRLWKPLKDFWIHKRVKSTIMLIKRVRPKIKLNNTEKEYISVAYPEILSLSKEYYWCSGTGASKERKWLAKRIYELQEKADKKLRLADITNEKQKFLEDIVYFADIKNSEIYGVEDPFKQYFQALIKNSEIYGVEDPFKQYFQALAKCHKFVPRLKKIARMC